MPRSHRQLRRVVGDSVAMRSVALHELAESRNDAMGRALRRDAMRRGIVTGQHDEGLVQLGAQEIDAVVPVMRDLTLHRRKPLSHSARRGRRQRHRRTRRVGVKVRQAIEERVVVQEFLGEELLEKQTHTVELRRIPSPDLPRRREEHRARADGMAVRVEPQPALAAGDEDDVEEREGERVRHDEPAEVMDPSDVDQQRAPVLAPVERHSGNPAARRRRLASRLLHRTKAGRGAPSLRLRRSPPAPRIRTFSASPFGSAIGRWSIPPALTMRHSACAP